MESCQNLRCQAAKVFVLYFMLQSVCLLHLLIRRCTSQAVCPSGSSISSCGVGDCLQADQAKAMCVCPSGQAPTGPNTAKCQPINVCTSEWTSNNICFNGGTCDVEPDNVNRYKCTCAPGFSGRNCQLTSNACERGDAVKCQNGGRCVPDSSQGVDAFYCICPKHYTGSRCEVSTYVGLGGAGVALSPARLILCWAVWICMALTFLYCGINMLIGWIGGMFKTRFASAAVAKTTDELAKGG